MENATTNSLKRRYLFDQCQADGWRLAQVGSATVMAHELLAVDGTPIGVWRVHTFTDRDREALGGKSGWARMEGGRLVKAPVPERLKGAAAWYLPRGLREAVEDSGGVAVLANGEKAVTAYRAGGVMSAFCTTKGEGAVPSDALELLTALGVKRLVYVHDRDEAGVRSAARWREALAGTGIEYDPRRWPDTLTERADANDALIACGGDRHAFWQMLASLEPAQLPEPAQRAAHLNKKRYEAAGGGRYDDWESAKRALIERVVERICAYDPRARVSGSWLNHRSLLREEKNPSAGFNIDSGAYHDFASGETMKLREYAQALGIDVSEYAPRRLGGRRQKNVQRQVLVSERVEPVFETSEDDIVVAKRYIEMGDVAGDVAVSSPMGTGKTAAIAQLVAQLPVAARALYIAPRQSLVADAQRRLNEVGGAFEHYQTYSGAYASSIVHADRLVICADSLTRVGEEAYDLVILDEAVQTLRHIASAGTLKDKAQATMDALSNILVNAKRVVALDAQLDNQTVTWLRWRRPNLRALRNDYRPQRASVTFMTSPIAVLEAAAMSVDASSKPVVIVTDSRAQARKLYQHYKHRLGEGAVLAFHAWNTGTRQAQERLAKLNELLPQARVLIASPTLATGVDVQADVEQVFAVFQNPNMLVADYVQMLGRYRRAQRVTLYCPSGHGQVVERAELAHFDVLAKRAELARAAGHLDRRHDVDVISAYYEALRRYERADMLSHLVNALRREGYHVHPEVVDSTPSREAIERYRELGEALHRADLGLMLSAPPLPVEELRRRRIEGKAREIDFLAAKRFVVESATGQALDERLYARYVRKRDALEALRRADDWTWGDDVEQDRQRDENLPLHRRRYARLYRDVMNALAQYLSIEVRRDGEGNIVDIHMPEYDRQPLLQRLEQFFAACPQALMIVRAHDSRAGLSDDPIAVLRRMLHDHGLKLTRKRVRRGEVLTYAYTLDPDTTRELLIDLRGRRAACSRSVEGMVDIRNGNSADCPPRKPLQPACSAPVAAQRHEHKRAPQPSWGG